MYRTDELVQDKEEVGGTVLGGGGKEVSKVPVAYPRGVIIFSSLGSFLSVGYSYKPSYPFPPLYIGARHNHEYSNKRRDRKRKCIKPHQDNASNEEQIKRSEVIVQENLVIGYLELIPIVSGAELSAPHDTTTVRVANFRQSERKNRISLWMEDN